MQSAFQQESLSNGVYYEVVISYEAGHAAGGYVPVSALIVRYSG